MGREETAACTEVTTRKRLFIISLSTYHLHLLQQIVWDHPAPQQQSSNMSNCEVFCLSAIVSVTLINSFTSKQLHQHKVVSVWPEP
jgi:hypothetical protein